MAAAWEISLSAVYAMRRSDLLRPYLSLGKVERLIMKAANLIKNGQINLQSFFHLLHKPLCLNCKVTIAVCMLISNIRLC